MFIEVGGIRGALPERSYLRPIEEIVAVPSYM